VIVPAYGVAHLLGDALASLQAQHFQDWEAIVIDDGAPDDVASAFQRFADDKRLRLLRTDNQGLATARNRAIAASSAPFIALLDGDDLYEPAYLERMLSAIEADPNLGFVSCDALIFGPGERAQGRYSRRYPMTGPVSLERVLSREISIFVAAIIRRAALDQVGGFDGRLRSVEDLDLWIRLLAADWSGAVVLEPLARYRRRSNSLSTDTRSMLAACCSVYRKASGAMDGRPERAVAERLLATYEEELRWHDGKDWIRRGDFAAGLPLLAGAERRSPRWGVALAIMRRTPRLAGLLLRLRTWLLTRASRVLRRLSGTHGAV
jgi:glycosyltransferase involved in cell wall biosynthesis